MITIRWTEGIPKFLSYDCILRAKKGSRIKFHILKGLPQEIEITLPSKSKQWLDKATEAELEKLERQYKDGLKNAFCAAIERHSALLFHLDSFASCMNGKSYAVSLLKEVLQEADGEKRVIVILSQSMQTEKTTRESINELLLRQKGEQLLFAYGEKGDSTQAAFEKFYKANRGNVLPFRQRLSELVEKRIAEGLFKKPSEVYFAAGISKATFSKIGRFEAVSLPSHEKVEKLAAKLNVQKQEFGVFRQPSKLTVAALAFALRLTEEECEEFFKAAGYGLSYEKEDMALRFFLREGQKDKIVALDGRVSWRKEKTVTIDDVNECLYFYGWQTLGTKPRE